MIKRARQMGVPNGRTLVVLGCAALVLSACEEGQGFGLQPADQGPPVETAATGDAVESDVEAPEVFELTDRGLWDGRPSLGGVWVAHPDVSDPERVIIRNPSNGTSVIGALFRRERENLGPALQVSSDAAEELDILAGQPTTLQVTALRTKAVPVAPERALSDEVIEETPQVAEDTTDAAPVLAEAQPSTKPIARPETEGDEVAAAIASAAAAAIASSETAPAAPSPAVMAESDALAPATARASRDPAAAKKPTAQRTAARSAPAQKAQPASGLAKPYIQIGIFSVKQNADNTAASLRGIGILPTVKAQSSQGKKFWRVIVGPAQSSSERSVLLKKVKDLGFGDAYFVTN
ncbi:MAG: SPOR domain-containing protein [Paracoccaceae bacterium]